MADIRFKAVKKIFGDTEVISGLNLDIKHGEFIVLLGPSGCAKSTTLRLLAGLEAITDSELYIDDVLVNDLTPKQRGIAMVFQNYALYPHMTVYQNIAFSMKIARVNKTEISEKVRNTAEILQLTLLLERYPATLSGGQRQRVAIGRAMVRNPKVFLFDEPLSNLDAKLRNSMRVEIKLLHEKIKATMVYVTHDQIEAMTLADRIVVMNKGELVQVGTPEEIYLHPANHFVATFIGSPTMNTLPVEYRSINGDGHISNQDMAMRVDANDQHAAFPEKLLLGIRPNHIAVCERHNALLSGTIKMIEYMGNEQILHVQLQQNHTLVVQVHEDHHFKFGQMVYLNFIPHHYYLFDAESGETLYFPGAISKQVGDAEDALLATAN